MLNLKFKTWDGSNFKSKSRIYFSAHPNDFNLLDKFADAILDKYNCAIFYNDETDIDIDDLKEQLKYMQLMIVPITKVLKKQQTLLLNISKQKNKKSRFAMNLLLLM